MIGRTMLAEVCALLNEHEARYVLLGGFALQLWGFARVTKDIDILIERSVPNAERVLQALAHLTGGLARDLLAEEIVKKPITVVGDLPRVDIMTVAWQVGYAEASEAAKVFEVDGVTIPTASIEHLIASKRTGRPQDAADIEVLEEIRKHVG